MDDVWAALDALDATKLDEVAWADYPYKPSVHMKIAHTPDSLVLAYLVKEKHVRAKYRNTNDPVYRDSCVEFFVSFDGERYYNLEFNCLGTGLIGYGTEDKSGRRLLPKHTVEDIKTYSHIKAQNSNRGDTEWQLLLNIPFSVFDVHRIHSLAGMECMGNFYKCGDELPMPHFVSWNRIDSPVPNFHLPQYFGELFFQ
ncbi:Carbohydrate-binding family 9 [Parapedobacter koreensis]|uniref:Carbohydrate-binding family 9 n=2 Tax=Parapedobacter koreensis TaxID=332977 RepID=A0A1H7I678_9SPHI|nr:Carbohydrate-binding family 9 [Parapedobacter koreensis]